MLWSKQIFKEFPHKSWSRNRLDKIIRKTDRTGTSKRLPGTADKIEEVETLALSQEDLPQTHHTQRQIAR